jgi:hypothetical protein
VDAEDETSDLSWVDAVVDLLDDDDFEDDFWVDFFSGSLSLRA